MHKTPLENLADEMRQAETEVVTNAESTAAELRQHADTINTSIDLIVKHEDAFRESTLEPCLIIGREIAKAQAIFGLNKNEQLAAARESKSLMSRAVTPDDQEPDTLGFAAWLAREIPRLKRPTAIKYATSFKGLELSTDTPDSEIRAKVKTLRHHAGQDGEPMPSLASLYKAGRPSKEEMHLALTNAETPADRPQQKLRDAREAYHTWIERGEKLVALGHLDALDQPGIAKVREFNLWLRDRLNAR
jgi:hypothetical protein